MNKNYMTQKSLNILFDVVKKISLDHYVYILLKLLSLLNILKIVKQCL